MTPTFAQPTRTEQTTLDISAPYEAEYSIPADSVNSLAPTSNGTLADDSSSRKAALRVMGGAAVVGGVAGLLLVGPVVGLAAAGGAAALSTTKGRAGDVTRATGEVVANAGSRLKKLDQKHHITDKATNGVVKSANWISNKIKPTP